MEVFLNVDDRHLLDLHFLDSLQNIHDDTKIPIELIIIFFSIKKNSYHLNKYIPLYNF